MYGKIFEQMYNSTVCQDWKVLVTFQQCIILSDDLGILDMTQEAISRRTGIPVEIIRHGIDELEKPDPRSRSQKAEGKRLERIDSHRDWGWVVVNKPEYIKLANRLQKQENDRVRISKTRAISKMSQPVAECSKVSQNVANVAHIDKDLNKDLKEKIYKKEKPKPKTPLSKIPESFEITDELKAWASTKNLGLISLEAETEKFLNYCRAHGKKYVDVVAAWRNWIINAQNYASSRPQPPPPKDQPPPEPTTPEGWKEWQKERDRKDAEEKARIKAEEMRRSEEARLEQAEEIAELMRKGEFFKRNAEVANG